MARLGLTAAVTLAAAAVALTGCSAGRSPEAAAPIALSGSGLTAPVPTVVNTPGGTWATVPMGHLDDPLNTFWQLLYRPAGATQWTNQVEATAAATNGGLDLAPGPGNALIVGIRPSNRLIFSPLIATINSGRTWQNGLLPAGLAHVPDAIAATGQQTFALVTSQSQTEVLAAGADLSTWHPVATQSQIAATPAGRSCGLAAVTAVAYDSATPIVGGRCTNPATLAVFALTQGQWEAAGPDLHPPAGAGGTTVIDLQSSGGSLNGLFATAQRSGVTAVTAGWTTDAGQHWQTSPPIQLDPGQQLVSYGPDGSEGLYLLTATTNGDQTLDVIDGPGRSWRSLPPPPPGTQTVVLAPGTETQALTVNSATLSVWSLSTPSSTWVKGQVMNVAIDYGSSS